MLIRQINKFRVVITIWNEDEERMELLNSTMTGHSWPKENKWEGNLHFEAYSEGIDATLEIFETIGSQLKNIRSSVAKKG